METNSAEVYVASTLATIDDGIPHNLPVAAIAPSIGYQTLENSNEGSSKNNENLEEFADLENQAHTERVLLSSDAIRLFISKIQTVSERKTLFATLIKKARVSFPSEDGWVILNLIRMEALLLEINHVDSTEDREVNSELENSVSYISVPASSLAEMILSKNSISARALISDRPMIALADAVSELQIVIAIKAGGVGKVSELLTTQSKDLSSDTLMQVVGALTSALDGTYTDEKEAVEHAIVKAIAVLS